MRDFLKPAKRKSGKWHDILPIAVIVAVLIAWAVFIIGYTPVETAIMSFLPYSKEITEFLLFYFSFVKIWIIVIPLLLINYNRPMLGQLALAKGWNKLSVTFFGFILGFGTNGACILFSALRGDIRLSYSSFDPLLIFLFFIVILIQCGAEELVDRLYLYQKLRRRYYLPVVAILGSTVAFVGNHLFAPGFSIVAAVLLTCYGILAALFVYYYDCFWAAIMFHTAWNFTQSIIFGLPNSGEVSAYSIFTIDMSSTRDGFFYDSAFGVEGSVGSVLILITVIIAIIWMNRGKGEKNDLWT